MGVPLRGRRAAQAKQLGGRVCLDFANTVAAWERVKGPAEVQPEEDRLAEYTDLLAWSIQAGLLDAPRARRLEREGASRPDDAAAALDRARRLREAIYRIGWRLAHRTAARGDDRATLAAAVGAARARQRLTSTAERLGWELADDPSALDAPLWRVALDAEAFFTTADLTRLRACPGESCGWLFEDATRNRSRQWCDMADCGNLAKVRRFRERRLIEPLAKAKRGQGQH